MKGFGIEIKNDLLDPKHVRALGESVWLYMWLIDKMTSYTEDGKGRVLGGRPVKFEEIETELGISRKTYFRWIKKLKDYPYIETTRTPYGIVFIVLKAHKFFGKRYVKKGTSLPRDESYVTQPDVSKVSKRSPKRDASRDKSDASNKTIQLDNTKTSHRAGMSDDIPVKSKNNSKSLLEDPTFVVEMKTQFPAVDVDQEIDIAKDWLASRGKKYQDYRAFMRNWLRRKEADSRYNSRFNRNNKGTFAKIS